MSTTSSRTTIGGTASSGPGSVPGRPGFGEPAPSLRRPRNLPGAILGVLVVVVCSLAVAALASSSGGRTDVLVVTRPVPAGQRISASDLASAAVSADGQVSAIRASELPGIVGQVASHDLVPGALLVPSELAGAAVTDPSEAIVGLAVKDGDLPSQLGTGDHAAVIATAAGPSASSTGAQPTTPAVLVADALVRSVAPSADGQSTLVSLAVPAGSAATVAEANAEGTVSLVLVGG